IDAEHRLGVRHPQSVIGRDMKQAATTRHRRCERVGVFERAFRDLDTTPLEVAAVAVRPRQPPHRMAGLEQRASDGRADKPGGAGNQAQTRRKRYASPVINRTVLAPFSQTLAPGAPARDTVIPADQRYYHV